MLTKMSRDPLHWRKGAAWLSKHGKLVGRAPCWQDFPEGIRSKVHLPCLDGRHHMSIMELRKLTSSYSNLKPFQPSWSFRLSTTFGLLLSLSPIPPNPSEELLSTKPNVENASSIEDKKERKFSRNRSQCGFIEFTVSSLCWRLWSVKAIWKGLECFSKDSISGKDSHNLVLTYF